MARTPGRVRGSCEPGNGFLGELVEFRLPGLGTVGEMRCFERNDLGFKAGNLGRGVECLNVREILFGTEQRLLGIPVPF